MLLVWILLFAAVAIAAVEVVVVVLGWVIVGRIARGASGIICGVVSVSGCAALGVLAVATA
eukprot:15453110-Alexandrium_andersonii.AAC.1